MDPDPNPLSFYGITLLLTFILYYVYIIRGFRKQTENKLHGLRIPVMLNQLL
jgi:hypothetical protein